MVGGSHAEAISVRGLCLRSGLAQAWEENARRVEALGYAILVMPDHFMNPNPVPALATAAAVTTTLRIGTIVFANDFRHPALLAKEAATLDLLSDGRFEFGLGAGWFQTEYERAGIAFDPPGRRIDRMHEALTIFKGLWSDEPLTFQGTHYAIAGLDGTPKPVQKPHPPIFIGGTGRACCGSLARKPTSSASSRRICPVAATTG